MMGAVLAGSADLSKASYRTWVLGGDNTSSASIPCNPYGAPRNGLLAQYLPLDLNRQPEAFAKPPQSLSTPSL